MSINLDPQQPVTPEDARLNVLILGLLGLLAPWRHQAELGQTRHWRRWARTLTRMPGGAPARGARATIPAVVLGTIRGWLTLDW